MPPKNHDFQQVIADAAGSAICSFVAPFDEDWHVERISVNSSGAAVPEVAVYVGSIAQANRKDWTSSGDDNIADESSPVYVPGGSTLFVVFTGATAGSTNTTSIQYEAESTALELGALDVPGLLENYPGGVDNLLIQRGFPNQNLRPRARR